MAQNGEPAASPGRGTRILDGRSKVSRVDWADAARALNEAWLTLQAFRDSEAYHNAGAIMKKVNDVQRAMDLVAEAHEAFGIHPMTEESS